MDSFSNSQYISLSLSLSLSLFYVYRHHIRTISIKEKKSFSSFIFFFFFFLCVYRKERKGRYDNFIHWISALNIFFMLSICLTSYLVSISQLLSISPLFFCAYYTLAIGLYTQATVERRDDCGV